MFKKEGQSFPDRAPDIGAAAGESQGQNSLAQFSRAAG